MRNVFSTEHINRMFEDFFRQEVGGRVVVEEKQDKKERRVSKVVGYVKSKAIASWNYVKGVSSSVSAASKKFIEHKLGRRVCKVGLATACVMTAGIFTTGLMSSILWGATLLTVTRSISYYVRKVDTDTSTLSTVKDVAKDLVYATVAACGWVFGGYYALLLAENLYVFLVNTWFIGSLILVA